MSAAVATPRWLGPMERFRVHGGTQHSALITRSGQVMLITLVVTARGNHRGETELWPRRVEQECLGVVDPFNPSSWCTAEAMLKRRGYRPVGDWTTVDSCPAVLLRWGK